jgi:DNA-binding transcriptional regulator YiaG
MKIASSPAVDFFVCFVHFVDQRREWRVARKWSELVARMSPESKARVAAAVERMKREIPLIEVRRQLNLSQQALAERMGVSRSSVSRFERQSGMHLRELRRIVEAMGGELEITARFPDGEIRLDEWERNLPTAEIQRG